MLARCLVFSAPIRAVLMVVGAALVSVLAPVLELAAAEAPQRVATSHPTVAGIDFRAPDGSFTVRVPAGWNVDEVEPGLHTSVAFRRPMDATRIEISFHPATHDSSRAAEAYVVWSSTPVGPVLLPPPTPRRITVNGMAAVEASAQRQPPEIPLEPLALPDGNGHVLVEMPRRTKPQLLVTRTVAVPVRGGFFALECTHPVEDSYSADAFEAVLDSFRLAARASR